MPTRTGLQGEGHSNHEWINAIDPLNRQSFLSPRLKLGENWGEMEAGNGLLPLL